MGTFRSNLPLGTSDPTVFVEGNVPNLDEAVNSQSPTWADRFGVNHLTLAGHGVKFDNQLASQSSQFTGFMDSSSETFQRFLDSSGYSGWDTEYAAGIVLNSHNQGFTRCEPDGTACMFYTPLGTTPLPYTTTGDWASESALFVARSADDVLRQDLASPGQGVSLVYGAVRYISSVADISTANPSYHGEPMILNSYHGGWAATQRGPEGGGIFVWDSLSEKDPDGGTVFSVSGVSVGRWIRQAGDSISAEDFGAKGDGVTDDFPSINAMMAYSRSTNTPCTLAAKSYFIGGGSLNISGVTMSGVYRGHRNVAGTKVVGNGTATILKQDQLTTPNQYFDISNIRVERGLDGIETRYPLYARLTNIDVIEPLGIGFILGDSSIDAGPLGLYADCVRVVDSFGPAFQARAKEYNNSSVLFRCWFQTSSASQACVDIDVPGGYGALSLRFVKCQVAGPGAGFNIKRAYGLVLDQIFMETSGPALRLLGSCQVEVRSPIFGSLRNDNAFGEPNFIQHSGAGTARISISNPYITLGSGPDQANLRLVGSSNPGSLYVDIDGRIAYGAPGENFSLFSGNILQSNVNISERTSFQTEWRGSTTNPTLGNGTLDMNISREGTQVTVSLRLVIGSTTQLGSGGWTFTLPYLSRMVASAQGYALKGTTRHPVLGSISGRVLSLWLPGTASPISPTQPFAWESGNSLVFTFTYQV